MRSAAGPADGAPVSVLVRALLTPLDAAPEAGRYAIIDEAAEEACFRRWCGTMHCRTFRAGAPSSAADTPPAAAAAAAAAVVDGPAAADAWALQLMAAVAGLLARPLRGAAEAGLIVTAGLAGDLAAGWCLQSMQHPEV